LWGGFSIGNSTLNRFFSLHFLIPFILLGIILLHLISLHITGSNKPLGTKSNTDKIPFHPFFSFKDLNPIVSLILVIIITSIFIPFSIGDPENFNLANPLNTPIHIQPEWYFLFAYAILRSIPNKLGGVIALIIRILMLIPLSFLKKIKQSKKIIPNIKI
jgi:ubiquinol-cytochrome c reductase cytochrome b subunit